MRRLINSYTGQLGVQMILECLVIFWFEHVSERLLQGNSLRSPNVEALCTWCVAHLESRDNTLMLRREESASLPNSAGVHEGNSRHSKPSKCSFDYFFCNIRMHWKEHAHRCNGFIARNQVWFRGKFLKALMTSLAVARQKRVFYSYFLVTRKEKKCLRS